MASNLNDYAEWRRGKDATRMGDPPRLVATVTKPYTGEHPWCRACDANLPHECYCANCKGVDPLRRGVHFDCWCYFNRTIAL